MKKFVILENYSTDIKWEQQIAMAKAYQDRLNTESDDYIVIPLMCGLKMKTIELDKNGIDIYIEELKNIRDKIGE